VCAVALAGVVRCLVDLYFCYLFLKFPATTVVKIAKCTYILIFAYYVDAKWAFSFVCLCYVYVFFYRQTVSIGW
jgi:hypothetical protein